jgi:hypothetical protein
MSGGPEHQGRLLAAGPGSHHPRGGRLNDGRLRELGLGLGAFIRTLAPGPRSAIGS